MGKRPDGLQGDADKDNGSVQTVAPVDGYPGKDQFQVESQPADIDMPGEAGSRNDEVSDRRDEERSEKETAPRTRLSEELTAPPQLMKMPSLAVCGEALGFKHSNEVHGFGPCCTRKFTPSASNPNQTLPPRRTHTQLRPHRSTQRSESKPQQRWLSQPHALSVDGRVTSAKGFKTVVIGGSQRERLASH